MSSPIIIEDYNPEWAATFQRFKKLYEEILEGLEIQIEHVGSTSVIGLAAKPKIDIDIIYFEEVQFPLIKERLLKIGYHHRGDLGIHQREVFSRPLEETIKDESPLNHSHNLYVCLHGIPALQNHLIFRDFLRQHPNSISEYSQLKKNLAKKFSANIDAYIEAKTSFITEILVANGMEINDIREIILQNKADLSDT